MEEGDGNATKNTCSCPGLLLWTGTWGSHHINSLWPSDTMTTLIWVNIDSSNGLVPDGTKPLPEPMLANHQWFLWLWEEYPKKSSWCQSDSVIWVCKEKKYITDTFPRDQWVKIDKSLRSRQNGRHFDYWLRHLQMHFLEWKCMNFNNDFTEVCS